MVQKDPDEFGERVLLIDYEASGYLHQGFDLGCHFNNWCTNAGKSGFNSDLRHPSDEIQREYVVNYLDEMKKLAFYEFDEKIDNVERLLKEVKFFALQGMLEAMGFGTFLMSVRSDFITKEMISGFMVS